MVLSGLMSILRCAKMCHFYNVEMEETLHTLNEQNAQIKIRVQ